MVVLERRYRVLVDVVVELSELAEVESCEPAKALFHTWQQDPIEAERDCLAAQKRLLGVLLTSPSALDTWLRREAVRHVLDSGLEPYRVDTAEEELLGPVIACLPPPDREFFQDAIDSDDFCEFADPFLDATSGTIVGIAVSDGVPPLTRTTPRALACRSYRVSIDVQATIREIDPPEAEACWLKLQEWCEGELKVTPDEFTRLQHSLLATLQRCERELDLWLKQEVLREIVDYGDEPAVPEASDQEILGPVLARLEPADRFRFEALLEDGTLYEGARAFYRALSAATRDVIIAEMTEEIAAFRRTSDPIWSGTPSHPAARFRLG